MELLTFWYTRIQQYLSFDIFFCVLYLHLFMSSKLTFSYA